MRSRKLGGIYQLRLPSPDDLSGVMTLDEARWMASSAPVPGLDQDPAFLAFVDGDGDGRIRADDVRAAVDWLARCLKDRGGVIDGEAGGALSLAALSFETPEGRAVRAAAVASRGGQRPPNTTAAAWSAIVAVREVAWP